MRRSVNSHVVTVATHALPGQMPLIVSIYDRQHNLVQEVRRDG